jgi:hypothetical protein
MLQKKKEKISWKEKGKKKTEKRKKEKEQKRKKNEKKIADQVGANGPAHTVRGGVRRGAKRRPDRSIGITGRTGS